MRAHRDSYEEKRNHVGSVLSMGEALVLAIWLTQMKEGGKGTALKTMPFFSKVLDLLAVRYGVHSRCTGLPI